MSLKYEPSSEPIHISAKQEHDAADALPLLHVGGHGHHRLHSPFYQDARARTGVCVCVRERERARERERESGLSTKMRTPELVCVCVCVRERERERERESVCVCESCLPRCARPNWCLPPPERESS